MEHIASYYLQPLSWHQPKARALFFELRAIGTLVGNLTLGGFLGSRATARSADGTWQSASAASSTKRFALPRSTLTA